MNKVYVLQNSDGEIFGVFTNRAIVNGLMKIGKKKWKEDWYIEEHTIDHIHSWLLKDEKALVHITNETIEDALKEKLHGN